MRALLLSVAFAAALTCVASAEPNQPQPSPNGSPPRVVGAPGVSDVTAPRVEIPPSAQRTAPNAVTTAPSITSTNIAPSAQAGVATYYAMPSPSAVSVSHGRGGNLRTLASEPVGVNAALSSFFFRYDERDHRFRILQVAPQGGNEVRIGFADQNDDDEWLGEASWWGFTGPSTPQGTMAAYALGSGIIDIELRGRPGYTPALRGFVFERRPGSDNNVRSIGIEFIPAPPSSLRRSPDANWLARVRLFDNSGENLQTVPRRTDHVFPPAAAFADYAAGAAALGRDTNERYLAGVQVAWVPNSAITSTTEITGGQFADARRLPVGASVITGFQFDYLDSDHFTRMIKVSSDLGGAMTTMSDWGGTESIRWWATFVTLRNPPR